VCERNAETVREKEDGGKRRERIIGKERG